MPDLDLSNATVLVTGAGGRLGRVVVRRALDAGARVVALDAVPPDGLPEGALVYTADLTDEAAVEGVFDAVAAEVGAVDALVHTVGMWDGAPFAQTSLAAWRTMLDVNLTSLFLCFRAAARRMAAGRLVAVAARQGADGGAAQQAAYSASKAGVVRLVEAVAAEYDGRLTAAAVAPSTLLFGGEADGAKGVTAEAVADLCLWLCGDGGAVHNGTVLRAYGTG